MTEETTRPDYGDTIEAQLIADMVSSGETLIDALRLLNLATSTTYQRLASPSNPKFAAMMNDARAAGFDVIANNMRKVAAGEEGYSSGDVKRDKLIIETDAKLLSKWHPTVYGEKLQVETKSAVVNFPTDDDPIRAQQVYEDLMKKGR